MKSLDSVIRFPKSGTAVTDDQREIVERVATYLKNHPEATCVIKGYASPEGKEDANMKLANRRAASVRNMLVNECGIAASRVEAAIEGLSKILDLSSCDRVSICEIIVK